MDRSFHQVENAAKEIVRCARAPNFWGMCNWSKVFETHLDALIRSIQKTLQTQEHTLQHMYQTRWYCDSVSDLFISLQDTMDYILHKHSQKTTPGKMASVGIVQLRLKQQEFERVYGQVLHQT